MEEDIQYNELREEVKKLTLKTPENWRTLPEIDANDVSQSLIEQPGKYAYYASLYAYATHRYEEAKADLQVTEAKSEQNFRQSYGAGDNRLTVKQVETHVVMDSNVKQAKLDLRTRKLEKDLAKAAVDSFEQRMQSLISIGAMQRAELKGTDATIGYGVPRTPYPSANTAMRDDAVRSKTSRLSNSPFPGKTQ